MSRIKGFMIKSFREISEIVYGFSNNEDGNMSFVWGGKEEVLKNREVFLKKSGLTLENGVTSSLQARDEMLLVRESGIGQGMSDLETAPKADALITNTKGIYLFMLTADCFPLSLYDPIKKVIGLVHLGWKGVDLEFAGKAIRKMEEKYGSNPKDILANIGPGIRKESYRFKEPIQKSLKDWQSYLKDHENGETSIDLVGYIKDQLIEIGLDEANIYDERIDTFRDENYYSHYRSVRTGEAEGRFATVLGLR